MTLTTPVYPSTSVLARYCAEMVQYSEVWPDINDKDVDANDREMEREEPEIEVTLSPSDERTLTLVTSLVTTLCHLSYHLHASVRCWVLRLPATCLQLYPVGRCFWT